MKRGERFTGREQRQSRLCRSTAEIGILTGTPDGTAGRRSLLNRLTINSVAYMGHGC